MKNEHEIVNVVMMALTFIGILFGVAILGLTFSIIKGIMLTLGLDTNL